MSLPFNIDDLILDRDSLSNKELMAKYNLKRHQLFKIVEEHGLPRKTPKLTLLSIISQSALDEIVRKFNSGVNITALAKEYEVSFAMIKNYLKSIGYEFSKAPIPFKPTDINLASFVYDYIQDKISMPELLEKYNISEHKYRIIKDKLGLTSKKQRLIKALSLDDRISIEEDASNGLDVSQLSEKYNVDWSTMKRYLLKHGIEPENGLRTFEKLTKEYLQEQINNDKFLREIAEEVGCSEQTVAYQLNKFGINRTSAEVVEVFLKRGKLNKNKTWGKRVKYESDSGKSYTFRSTWEHQVALYLDRHRFNWKYEMKTYSLGDMTYLPDFFIFDDKNNLSYLIEVKGRMTEKDSKKLNLFEILYPNIPIYLWDAEVIKLLKKEVA